MRNPSTRNRMVEASDKKRNTLIKKYEQYVEYIAARLVKSMRLPKDIYGECVSAGYLGLVEAASRYDETTGNDFRRFAYLRIKGSMIDSIRAYSDLSAGAYRYARALQAIQDLREGFIDKDESESKSEEVNEAELAKVLEYAAQGAVAFRLSFAEAEKEANEGLYTEDDPESLILSEEARIQMRKIVDELPEKEQRVIKDYYFGKKSFMEIGKVIGGHSKSWVSRIHIRALVLIKERYQEAQNA